MSSCRSAYGAAATTRISHDASARRGTGARTSRTRRGNERAGSGRAADVEVWVDVAGTPTLAGRLFAHRHGRTDSASFTYDPSWVSDDAAYALDPALPLVSGTLQTPSNQKLFGAFTDSCPDRWGRRLIERTERHRGKRDEPSAGQLRRVRSAHTSAGRPAARLHPVPSATASSSSTPPSASLRSLICPPCSRRQTTLPMARLTRTLSRWRCCCGKAPASAAPGPRHTSVTVMAASRSPSSRSPSDEWNVMAWEKTALDLAGAAGIVVPDNQLVTVGGRNVLIVDRFDRRAGWSTTRVPVRDDRARTDRR